MIAKTFTTAAAALALTATPVFAQEASIDRSPAPVVEGEQLEGGSGIILALLAAAAIIAGIIVAAGDSTDEADLPTSP